MRISDLFRFEGCVGECIATALRQIGATVMLSDRLPPVDRAAASLVRDSIEADNIVFDVTRRLAADGVVSRCGGYDVGKGGRAPMCRELSSEWVTAGTRINAVGSGCADTELLAELGGTQRPALKQWIDGIAKRRLLRGEEIASAIAFPVSYAAIGFKGQLLMVEAGDSAA